MELSMRTVNNNLKDLEKYFKENNIEMTRYIIAKEFGKKNNNEHYHYHIELANTKLQPDSIRRAIRRLLHKIYDSKNYYVKTVKDTKKHILYVTKDGDYQYYGYTKDEMDEFDEKNEDIEHDKQLPVYQKLYNKIMKSNDSEQSLSVLALDKKWIIRQILIIYKQWDKPPPTKSLMFQYINYIQAKEDLLDIVVENYM